MINAQLGLYDRVVDEPALMRTVARFRDRGIVLPTFSELADPNSISVQQRSRLADVDPDAQDPTNLFRVHWYNDASRRGTAAVPEHLVLTNELTGVVSPIVVALGNRFPMIRAHKVLAAYACLAPRVVTGAFDPTRDRAIWPSTGNYARGGVAISRIMDCRGVAVLPEGMSRERFDWLERWIVSPDDVMKTTGTESNVKEIYDACRELAKTPGNVIFNQFAEFSNHLGHYRVTAPALERLYETVGRGELAAFVSASGSAGTLGAGDYLKERHRSRTVAVEALECPTMLYNGFGEHNIQGIGDKHIPLIHNAMNTDDAVAITDRATDALLLVFNTDAGRQALTEFGVQPATIEALSSLGLSSICNVLAAIQTARHHRLGPEEVILTVATDGAEMYGSEVERIGRRDYPDGFTASDAKQALGRYLEEGDTGDYLELGEVGRRRIFNLGYYTWVEQQDVPIATFEARRHQGFWTDLRRYLDVWDAMIDEFNERVRAAS
ncbi:MAG TPA: pyridoxal-phosphate dependent enzyme [Acidimicrobiia bacterium]|jgi:cysteine synthase